MCILAKERSDDMLEVKNLYCGYEDVDVIKNVNFKVERGKNLCIVGPNGCGKSTLLKSIANIIKYKGSITVSYTHLTLPTTCTPCRSRWSPYH